MRKGMKRFMSMGLGAVMALTGTGASAMCVQAADDPVEISIAYWDADSAFVGDDVLSEIEDKLNIKITPVNIIPRKSSCGLLLEVCRMYLQGISETAKPLQTGQLRA